VSDVTNLDSELPAAARNELPGSATDYHTPVSVQNGYERWASTYDDAANPLLAREQRYLAPLIPSLDGKYVLDLACGTGRWLENLLASGAELAVGIDSSMTMLGVARRKPAISGQLVRADCVRLPFGDSIFNLAVCCFALGHIRDLGAMVHELARVMKPEADFFVTDLHPEAYASGWRTGFRDRHSSVQIETVPRTAEEIITIFSSAGFECRTHVALCLGEPEKPIFAQAGKIDLFPLACRMPAVLVCQFRRVASAMGYRSAA
jgi:malonyl-CoA O-methyltransferase